MSETKVYTIKKTNKFIKPLVYTLLAIWTIINVFPIYWMFTFSLKNNDEIFGDNIAGLPKNWLWENYSRAMSGGKMGLYFTNSIIISVAAIILTLIAAVMATYAMSRIVWKGRKLMNKFFMLGLTIPIHSAILPVYMTLKKVHMLNSYQALIIPYAAFSLAMAILICMGFMDDIPIELDEAARIDGCGTWGTFFKIIVPLMTPALSTVGIYTFLQCWNELMFATIFNSRTQFKTLPAGINELFGTHTTDWGPVGAALVVATFPTLLVYVFLSKKIQSSFMAGAIKG
ncbi:MAG: carbohydrate ABC transporter permease [Lachnospiraceae bacterium]|nr:carbohydrate ABC transporter permease [Lachnospiraceae bacterium]